MTHTEVNPNHIEIDGLNERDTVDQDSEEFEQLVENIESVGTVIQPPLLRKTPDGDDDFSVIVGQRRVLAARKADDVEKIPVVLTEMNDKEALKATITENIDVFKQNVPMEERADALQQLWEAMGGEGVPSNAHLGDELGVPRNTIRTWLEPLHGHWEGTAIDPRSDTEDFFTGDELGERSIAEIRRMTEDGEEGEKVAKKAAEEGLGQTAVKTAKEIVEETDVDPYEAIEQLAAEEAEEEDTEDEDEVEAPFSIEESMKKLEEAASEEPHIEAEVTFDSTTSLGLKEYAEKSGQSPDEVIETAVETFLAEKGSLPGSGTDPATDDTEPRLSHTEDDSKPETKDGAERLFGDD